MFEMSTNVSSLMNLRRLMSSVFIYVLTSLNFSSINSRPVVQNIKTGYSDTDLDYG